MRFSRQEYWSGLPCSPPGDFPNPEIEPRPPALVGRATWKPWLDLGDFKKNVIFTELPATDSPSPEPLLGLPWCLVGAFLSRILKVVSPGSPENTDLLNGANSWPLSRKKGKIYQGMSYKKHFGLFTVMGYFLPLYHHCSSVSHVQLFATPWTAARQAYLSFTISQSLLKLMSIESMMPSSHSSSATHFFFLQSFPASGSFPMSWLFTSGGLSIGASASVLPMSIQGWFPLGLAGLILLSKGLSRVFSSTTIQKHQFFCVQPPLWSNSQTRTWLLENP